MFDQILDLVKQQIGGNPEIASSIPAGQTDAIHNEVASQVTNSLASHAAGQGGVGGLLSMLQAGLGTGSPLTGAIEGGLATTLGNKFGLSPAVTAAIAGALPAILQKFAHKAADPNDTSVTEQTIASQLTNNAGGILGGLFNK